MEIRKRVTAVVAAVAGISAITGAAMASSALASGTSRQGSGAASATSLAVEVPTSALSGHKQSSTVACTLPDGSTVQYFHCYTPQQIRAAYHVNTVAPLSNGQPNYGQGQTIVLVDAYGSPTAAADLQHFHNTFFPNLPNPNFQQVFPNGNPQYHNTCKKSKGLSGPCAAASWSGEATLDIEWAYSIAPEAHLILVGVPPAETLGVQGFPNLFKAISGLIKSEPPGTLFSMSFASAEQNFGGAAKTQTARFDKVFQQGLAKHDNFFAAAGDWGTYNFSKQHKETTRFPYPTVEWPASSPYVVGVGGTQLQRGWTWDPTSNDAFNPDGSFNPAYWNWTNGGNSQAVWNESWADIATGGGASAVYPRPSWQSGVDPAYGNHRLVPDTAWNAAVNGGVDVYITAYPQYNCGNSTGCWTVYGGTSAATPQTAGVVALANAARESAGKGPIGFLDPILYGGVGSHDYTDITPKHYGSAPKVFAGSDVTGITSSGQLQTVTVQKSVGDLVDNQLWEAPVAGYPTTGGYDPTTGWGTPQANKFVAALAAMP
jgi:subtilase family serine protease